MAMMCKQLGVSRSGFYAWLDRPESEHSRKDRALVVAIRGAHAASRKTYGSPRIHAELAAQGLPVGRKRVARLMREESIWVRRRRRFKNTTDSSHLLPRAPNILDRQFNPKRPGEFLAGDITAIPTREGWLYLAVVIDLFSRRVVGWAMSRTMDAGLALSALEMAVRNRRPKGVMLFHSDQGVQYASVQFRLALRRLGIVCSMSRKGNCWDNAVVESFFSTLKAELEKEVFKTRDEARSAVFEYIATWYNTRRRHSSLGYLSPEQYEAQAYVERLRARRAEHERDHGSGRKAGARRAARSGGRPLDAHKPTRYTRARSDRK